MVSVVLIEKTTEGAVLIRLLNVFRIASGVDVCICRCRFAVTIAAFSELLNRVGGTTVCPVKTEQMGTMQRRPQIQQENQVA